jgi:16S rRNA processing protein RimM
VHSLNGNASREMVNLGRIFSAFGVQGWVKVYSYTDPVENIFSYRRWYIGADEGWREIAVLEFRKQGKGLVARLKGCNTRDEAELLVGEEIVVPFEELDGLEDGHYYWRQLIGLRVINLEKDELGRVDHVIETGANDVLVVKKAGQGALQTERLIPYLVDKVVKTIDLDSGLMIVDWDTSW